MINRLLDRGTTQADGEESRGRPWWRYPLLFFLAVAVVLAVDVWWSQSFLGLATSYGLSEEPPFTGSDLLGGWYRFDGGWYRLIAADGYYSLGPDAQSPVAFFPAYPLTMRFVAVAIRDPILAGVVVTFLAGLALSLLFYRWTADRLGTTAARSALAVLLLYPYAYYLFGAVYADALFVVAAVAAFLLLERGHPVLAGVAGAVATAARPVGLAVFIGLVAVTIYKRRQAGERLRPSDAGVGISVLGFGAWSTYLWVQFGDPLLFQTVQGAPGWDQEGGPLTWFKANFFQRLPRLPFWLSDVLAGSTTHDASPFVQSAYTLGLLLHATLLAVALVMVPFVFRKLGWGYGLYALCVLAVPLLGSKDFQGMGRYVLAAFPCFAVAATFLVDRPVLRWAWFAVSGGLLLLLTSAYARGYYIS